MSAPKKDRCGGSDTTARLALQTPPMSRSQATRAVFVWANAVFPPAPGRRWWWFAVLCPRGHVHLHRGPAPTSAGLMRTAPCRAEYVILASVAAVPAPRAAS